MAGCRILGDAAVHELLMGLSRPEIQRFQRTLEESLRRYSVGGEGEFQPDAGITNRPDGRRTLFRPFTSPTAVGTKIIVQPAPDPATNTPQPLHGAVVLCDHRGIPTGLINAEELTGFRTVLGALVLWTARRHTDAMLVFGAGKQARWHIRLALALRGEAIRSITVVNRNAARADALVEQLRRENASRWKSGATIDALGPAEDEALRAKLAEADAVFCTVPSERVLFPEPHLALDARRRAPYISAIGSWQPHMIELDPALLTRVAAARGPGLNVTGRRGGLLVADDRASCLRHTGELVRSGLAAENVVELGEILDDQQHASPEQRQKLTAWLSDGLVVYKSVGVSLTDLATGEAILDMARQRGMGTLITDF